LVFFIGLLIARLVQNLVKRLFRYLTRTIREKLNSSILPHINLEESEVLIGKVLFWVVLFFFLTLITEIIGLPVITVWLKSIVTDKSNPTDFIGTNAQELNDFVLENFRSVILSRVNYLEKLKELK